jgi:hypothetical protein
VTRLADAKAYMAVSSVRRYRSEELVQTLERIRLKSRDKGIHGERLLSPMVLRIVRGFLRIEFAHGSNSIQVRIAQQFILAEEAWKGRRRLKLRTIIGTFSREK